MVPLYYICFRTASSFLAWTVWCGLSLQQIILSSTLWVYINLEDEYSDLFKPIGSVIYYIIYFQLSFM